MNIKKFEARTMKEALEMVKTQLGPDAVILSAKEVNKGFGIGGIKSIEITAAYSESTLKQKEYVKSRMPQSQQEKFTRIPARDQKAIMQKMIEDKLRESQAKERTKYANINERSTDNQKRYIDIDADLIPKVSAQTPHRTFDKKPEVLTEAAKSVWNNMEVDGLKTEIEQLKNLIMQFKQMPQSFAASHPGAEHGVDYNLREYYGKLTSRGVLPDIAGHILKYVQQNTEPKNYNDRHAIESLIARYILETTEIDTNSEVKFHYFVGPSGAGKSASMIKLASQLMLKEHKRVALISTDTIKVGADEQMKIFSQILNIPFVSIRSPSDWEKVIPYLGQVDHVLVDFASLSLRSVDELSYLKQMMPPISAPKRVHLVLSAKSKDTELLDVGQKYQAIGYDDLIFTSLDEATQFGTLYNLNQKLKTPLFAFGIGAKIPEDFEMASKERVLDLLLEITKNMQSQDVNL